MTELSPEETESMTGGYGKSISHVIIGLKTVKGTKQLKLDPTIYDALIKEKVRSFYLLAFLVRHKIYFSIPLIFLFSSLYSPFVKLLNASLLMIMFIYFRQIAKCACGCFFSLLAIIIYLLLRNK